MNDKNRISVGNSLVIDGREIVLVEDRFTLPDSLGEFSEITTSDGEYTLFVKESDLLEVEKDYPVAEVYGLWQFLYENDRLRIDNTHNVFYRNKLGKNGIYLTVSEDFSTGVEVSRFKESGNFFGNKAGAINFSTDTGWHEVNLDLDGCRVPDQKAITAKERSIIERQEKRKASIQTAVIVAVLVVLGLGVDMILRLSHESRVKEVEVMQSELQGLQSDIDFLRKDRLGAMPDIKAKIDFLALAFITGENMTTVPGVNKGKYMPPTYQTQPYVILNDDKEEMIRFVFEEMNAKVENIQGDRLQVTMGVGQ